MITLKDITHVMSYATLDFGYDSFIQVVDNATNAHYRTNENGNLLLGGDPAPCSLNELLSCPVVCIEYINDQCVITLQ